MLPFYIYYLSIFRKYLLCLCHCSTAVSSAYDGRRTMGVTAVVRAADDRRTVTNSK